MACPSILVPIAAILFATHLVQAYQNLGCLRNLGSIAPNDARGAINLIPVPELNAATTPAANGGRMTLAIPAAAHVIHSPVVFHNGHTVIEIEEMDRWGGGRASGRLSLPEEAFYLWIEARDAAVGILTHCVLASEGSHGGWARMPVAPPGQPERLFYMRMRGTKQVGKVLMNHEDRGWNVWPERHFLPDEGQKTMMGWSRSPILDTQHGSS